LRVWEAIKATGGAAQKRLGHLWHGAAYPICTSRLLLTKFGAPTS
jgi:hypothetical protein